MNSKLTIGDIKRLFPDNTLTLPDEAPVAGVTQDTRKLKPGEIYCCLRGEHFDGHEFIAAAFEKGAIAAMVETSCPDRPNLIRMPETLRGLTDLAAFYRARFSQPVIAITGSNGKTTSKEFLTHVLELAGPVVATPGNLNNHIGVPLTLLKFNEQAKAFVVELGMNHPGEIRHLARLTRPDLGLITNVGMAHLEGVGGTLAEVARVKEELFAELAANTVAIVNYDDPFVRAMPTRARRITFGLEPGAGVQAAAIHQDTSGTTFTIKTRGKNIPTQIALCGDHHVRNALAVFVIARELGVAEEIILAGLAGFTIRLNRGRLLKRGATSIVDDSYNANPDSMLAAFASFTAQFPQHRRIALLGGMLELGKDAKRFHREVGAAARAAGIHEIWALGENALEYLTGFGYTTSEAQAHFFDSHADLAQAVKLSAAGQGLKTALLLKGSRGMAMEKVLDSL